jgi:mono/diheme cytochrome c family protein
MCHGAAGEGKSAPAIKGKADVADVITKGGLAKAPHTKAIAGLTDDQAKAIAAFLK